MYIGRYLFTVCNIGMYFCSDLKKGISSTKFIYNLTELEFSTNKLAQ